MKFAGRVDRHAGQVRFRKRYVQRSSFRYGNRRAVGQGEVDVLRILSNVPEERFSGRSRLARRFADTVSAHGVYMDVFGMGVLITGDSGIGKSELALELVSRGHGLVADDVVELARTAPTTIEGRCPGMLKDYLEVRGLGLLNIRTIFGETAARRKMKLKLIVHLQKNLPGEDLPRLPLDSQSQEILGIPVRKVCFHVAPGRNLAVLLEAAVRNCILQLRGIDSMSEFINRQQQAVLDGNI